MEAVNWQPEAIPSELLPDPPPLAEFRVCVPSHNLIHRTRTRTGTRRCFAAVCCQVWWPPAPSLNSPGAVGALQAALASGGLDAAAAAAPLGSAECAAQLFALDFSWTYLNHGSYGATYRLALEVQAWYRQQLEAQPVRFMETLGVAGALKEGRGMGGTTAAAMTTAAATDTLPMVPPLPSLPLLLLSLLLLMLLCPFKCYSVTCVSPHLPPPRPLVFTTRSCARCRSRGCVCRRRVARRCASDQCDDRHQCSRALPAPAPW